MRPKTLCLNTWACGCALCFHTLPHASSGDTPDPASAPLLGRDASTPHPLAPKSPRPALGAISHWGNQDIVVCVWECVWECVCVTVCVWERECKSVCVCVRERVYACVCAHALSRFSRVWLCATLQTIACQAPLSMGFSRLEYWSGLPWAPPGDLPSPGKILMSPALAGMFFTTSVI